MATFVQMKDSIFEFMDSTYSRITSVYNHRGFRERHIDGMTLYAYLAERFPNETISRCHTVVSDIMDFCLSLESVYPFPDGEYWTIGELEKYVAWRGEQQ